VDVGGSVDVWVAVGGGVGIDVGVCVGGADCTSKAPISVPSPPVAFGAAGSSNVRGKLAPRWSAAREPVKPLLLPLSIAGLPKSSAMVWVGPPLSRKPFGSTFGSSGDAVVPVRSVAIVKPVLPSTWPIRLNPAEVKAPLTSALESAEFFAMMLLLIFTVDVGCTMRMPPPLPRAPKTPFPLSVLLVTLSVLLVTMPPPPG
jgi:hypothetical protein